MKHLLVIAAIAACHASPRPAPTRALSAEERVSASLVRWGAALEADDQRADTTDGGGQFALVYGATKLAASHVDGGADAVEATSISVFAQMLLSGTPWNYDSWFVYVPAGSLGPALVAAGVAREIMSDPGLVYVPVSAERALGKIREHQAAHRRDLRARRAWTCRLAKIERTIPASEPIFQRAAAVSTNIFAEWRDDIEGIWLVRARCASGPALFAITAGKDGMDRVLIAKLMTSPG